MSAVIAVVFMIVVLVGWPLLLSVLSLGTLVAGSPILYWLVPAAATVGFGGSWILLVNVVNPEERGMHPPPQHSLRQFSDDYDVPVVLIVGSASVSLWLLFVLRHSADPAAQWDLSRRSWVLFWEVLAIDLISLVLMLSSWSAPVRWATGTPLEQREGAKGLRRSMLRYSMCWLPASGWIAVAFVVDHSFVERWFSTSGKAFVAIPQVLVACSIALTILGVAYELAVYKQDHSAVPPRQQLCCTGLRGIALSVALGFPLLKLF
jgi:hypothetical protein